MYRVMFLEQKCDYVPQKEMLILTFRHGVLCRVYMVRKFFEDFGATIQARFLTFSNSKTDFFFS